MPRTVSLAPSWIAILATLALPTSSNADMILQSDSRVTFAEAYFMGVRETVEEHPTAPFARFESLIGAQANNPDPEGSGFANATAYQLSEFEPSYINLFGSTSGQWQITQCTYGAQSNGHFGFRLDECHEYQLDVWVEPGEGPGYVDLTPHFVGPGFLEITGGEIHETGRLGPGEYAMSAYSVLFTDTETADGAVYSVLWTCVPCSGSRIGVQPGDVTVGCGGTATFTVAPAGSTAGLTYQWRRNFVPITDDGHFSGATSRTLVIQNACDADAGPYDVVLSDGTVVEPSRLATLTVVNTPTGIETDAASQRPFSIEVSGPNPFGTKTSFRYAAPRPQRARIMIYNAAGALVRTLVDGVVSGSGTLTWDGATTGGSRAPAGIYFLRVETETARESRKIVLLR